MSVGDANFETLLAGVLSHDNAARKNAEAIYDRELESQPAVVVGQLLRCLASGQVGLALCVVFVRRRCLPRINLHMILLVQAGRLLTVANGSTSCVSSRPARPI